MKKFIFALMVLLAGNSVFAQNYNYVIPVGEFYNQPKQQVTLPAGTYIPFKFAETITSKTAQPGQRVKIIITEDIKNKKTLFFAKGAVGYVIVGKNIPARNLNKQGELTIGGQKYDTEQINFISNVAIGQVNYGGKRYKDGFIEDVNGDMQPIAFQKRIEGERNLPLKVFTFAMIWNPIGWILSQNKGGEAVIQAGTNGNAVLTTNVTI